MQNLELGGIGAQLGNVENPRQRSDVDGSSFVNLSGSIASVSLPNGVLSSVFGGALLVLPLLVVFAPFIVALFGFETGGFKASGIGLQAIASSGVLGGASLVGGLWAISNSNRTRTAPY